MNAQSGEPLEALLGKYTELEDYHSALDQYNRSQLSVFQWLLGYIWPSAGKASSHTAAASHASDVAAGVPSGAVDEASKRLWQAAQKLKYLEQMLTAEVRPHGLQRNEVVRGLQKELTSVRMQVGDAFSKPQSCAALGAFICYPRSANQALQASVDADLWKTGKELHHDLLQALDKLEQELLAELGQLAAEVPSEWLGSRASGPLARVDMRAGEPLKLQCIVPCWGGGEGRRAVGGYAISHMHGVSRASFSPNLYLNKATAYMVRSGLPIIGVCGLGLPLLSERLRHQTEAALSNLEPLEICDLHDVVKVEVVIGRMNNDVFRTDVQFVRQVVFHKSDNTKLRIPDCPEHQLLGSLSYRSVVPPEGCVGRVVAVSGQDHALRFHWVRAA